MFLYSVGSSMCGALSCDDGCHATPTGGKCFCNKGYSLDPSDNRTCVGQQIDYVIYMQVYSTEKLLKN